MMIIRYVREDDIHDIYKLAEKAGFGLTSLQPHMELLSAKLKRACDTVKGIVDKGDQLYLFVLEDTKINKVIGLCGIEVALGLSEPWYNFHVGTQVHSSKELGIYKSHKTLFLSNDHTTCSELCTLFLDPDYRKDKNGKFLSKIRFLYLAAFRNLFEKRIVAEMRGYSDAQGYSPFWDALGHKFFDIEFTKADYLSGTGQKSFIAEMMPRYPLYVDMLPEAAQKVIGQVHPNTYPAYKLLVGEGLRFQGYVDIFDGGATLEADVENLRSIKESAKAQVEIVAEVFEGAEPYLVSNDRYQDFRGLMIQHDPEAAVVKLTQDQANQLMVSQGDQVRILSLNPKVDELFEAEKPFYISNDQDSHGSKLQQDSEADVKKLSQEQANQRKVSHSAQARILDLTP